VVEGAAEPLLFVAMDPKTAFNCARTAGALWFGML
jgi:hypothetical protein